MSIFNYSVLGANQYILVLTNINFKSYRKLFICSKFVDKQLKKKMK